MQCTIKDECSILLTVRINAIDKASAENVRPPQYQIWFKNPATFPHAYGCQKVGASNLLTASWIKAHLLKEISLSFRAVTVRLLKKLTAVRLGQSLLALLKEK